ncbi:MAG TPA: type I glyceraldehyde-3-phosphate dehydrogenase [Jiangellaceae bacterium]
MTVRVGINGFGRIGRSFLRCALERDIKVVGINDVAPLTSLAHLLQYDSTYGRLPFPVRIDGDSLLVDHSPIAVTSHRDLDELDWGRLGAEVVIEASGRFRERDEAARHLKVGAKKVLISAPAKGADLTMVMGVNHQRYDPDEHDVISNASCTTNCVAPMVKVLDDEFGLVKGFMTTVHGYTNDQVVLDAPHKDLRRARSAAVNIIPTSTGAAKAVGLVLPELEGRLDGVALRVPVEDGSLVDLAAVLRRPVAAADVNDAFAEAAASGPLAGILRYTTAPIVSRDVVSDPASCILDASLTQADDELVKLFGWYDNEWGYTNRLADLAEYVGARM